MPCLRNIFFFFCSIGGLADYAIEQVNVEIKAFIPEPSGMVNLGFRILVGRNGEHFRYFL